jgi:hypothetical protein
MPRALWLAMLLCLGRARSRLTTATAPAEIDAMLLPPVDGQLALWVNQPTNFAVTGAMPRRTSGTRSPIRVSRAHRAAACTGVRTVRYRVGAEMGQRAPRVEYSTSGGVGYTSSYHEAATHASSSAPSYSAPNHESSGASSAGSSSSGGHH